MQPSLLSSVSAPGLCPYPIDVQPFAATVTADPTAAAVDDHLPVTLRAHFRYTGDKRFVSARWWRLPPHSTRTLNISAKYATAVTWPDSAPGTGHALLTIGDVRLADSGTYGLDVRLYDDRCRTQTRFELSVMQAPRVHLPYDGNRFELAVAGQEKRLLCEVSANPAPESITWSWRENGARVERNLSQIVVPANATHRRAELAFWPLESGWATCTAVSQSGRHVSATLKVLVRKGAPRKAPPEPPTVRALGESAVLTCRKSRLEYSGVMRWQRPNGGGPVVAGADVSVGNVTADGDDGDDGADKGGKSPPTEFVIVLRFRALTADQVGGYDCVALRLDGVEMVFSFAVGPSDLWWMYAAIGGGVGLLVVAVASGLVFFYIGVSFVGAGGKARCNVFMLAALWQCTSSQSGLFT